MSDILKRPIFVIAFGTEQARIEEVLRQCYLAFPSLAKELRFDEAFECILIDPSEALETSTAKSVSAALDVLGGIKLSPEAELAIESVAQARKPSKEWFGSALPFLEYKFSKLARFKAQSLVAAKIHRVLEERGRFRSGNWAMIAHALGTAVAHDALHLLFRKGIDGRKALLPARDFMSVFLTAANTCRLMEQDIDVYRSMVRPMARVGTGICEWHLNARHEWDPIAMPKPFSPVLGWPSPDAADRVQTVIQRHFLDVDIHSLAHHLEDPDLHFRFFEGITGRRIDMRELWDARDGFKRRADPSIFDGLRADLKECQLAPGDQWTRILSSWAKFASISKGLTGKMALGAGASIRSAA